MSTALYSWGNPLSFAPFLDHTWVTTYPMDKAPPSGSAYWYCWGDKHDTYRAMLNEGQGGRSLSDAISPSNTPALKERESHDQPSSTSGAIVYYGLDGVCHNVANEVLTSTATATTEPDRVQSAHGYPLSTFFFGTYGLNTDAWEKIVAESLSRLKLAGDDFIPIMEAAISSEKLAKVLEYRAEAQGNIRELRARVAVKNFDYYVELGLISGDVLLKLRVYLGYDEFYALFPSFDRKTLDHENMDWLRPPLD